MSLTVIKEMKDSKDKDAAKNSGSGIKPTEPVISPDFRQQTFTTKITTSMERTYLVADRYLLLGTSSPLFLLLLTG